jgi:hypothetical protein
MKLVIELLEKELERQNLLIATSERAKLRMREFPLFCYDKSIMEEVYPNMVQLKDQIENAIAYLKTKNNGN